MIKPTIGTRAKLIPRLRTKRPITSMFWLFVLIGIFDGKTIFIKVKPGRNRTNKIPRAERRYSSGYAFSGMANTVAVAAKANAIVVQYYIACFENTYAFDVWEIAGSFWVKWILASFSS